MFSIKGVAVLVIALGSAASVAAQSGTAPRGNPKAEVALDYSFMRANASPGQCGCFNLDGGSAEVAIHVYRNFSAVADITGEHADTTSIPGQSLSLLSYTGGPRFSFPFRRSQRTRITPFAQGLVGEVHGSDGEFPNSSGSLSNSANALAVLIGGGVDVAVSRRFSIRALQVDYGLNHLPNNANNSENLLRVSAGVLFRFR